MTTPRSHRLPVATRAQTWAVVRRLARPRRRLLLSATVVLLASAACGLAAPALLGLIVQTVAAAGSGATVLMAGAGIVVATLAAASLGAWGRVLLATLTQTALADLREDVIETVLGTPVSRVEEAGDGDIVSRVSGDVESVSDASREVVPSVVAAFFAIVVTVIGLGVIDWRLAAAATAALPVQAASLRWFRRRAPQVYRDLRALEAERGDAVLEAVEGAETVLALGEQEHHLGRVAQRSRPAIAKELEGTRLIAGFYNGLNMAELLGLAGVLAVGFVLFGSGGASVGAVTTAALFFHRLFGPMGTLLGQVDDLAIAGAGLARLAGVLQLEQPARPRRAPADSGISLRTARYEYRDGQGAVDDVSLALAPGEVVALVGASGAGKSTLARLIAGTLTATSGEVLVGGIEAHVVGQDVPGWVVLVDQDVHVFTGTVASDLRLAREDATQEQLAAAVREVGAHWVAELPDGLDTVVGVHGIRLRADQAQQLALARVLLADPAIVVLDEASADAPRDQSAAIDAAMAAVLRGRTGVIVAHRLDQTLHAHKTLVLAHGKVVQEGAHDDLVAADGPFQRLWRAWTGVG